MKLTIFMCVLFSFSALAVDPCAGFSKTLCATEKTEFTQLKCLVAKRAKLDASCKKHLTDNLNERNKCGLMILLNCPKAVNLRTDYNADCLAKHEAKLPADCRTLVDELKKNIVASKNELETNCATERQKLCPGLAPGASQAECVKAMAKAYEANQVSASCKAVMDKFSKLKRR